MANALGAWLGGVVIAVGWGYAATGYVGVVLGTLGLAVLVLGLRAARSVQVDRAVHAQVDPGLETVNA